MAAPPPSDFSTDAFQYPTEFGPSKMEFAPGDNGAPAESIGTSESNFVPRPKRIACVICRRRKLKCDGRRPSCSTCSRLGHECAYDDVRKKSGPKRGYVKQLEARLGVLAPTMTISAFELLQGYIANYDNCISPGRNSFERPGSRAHSDNLPAATVGEYIRSTHGR